MKSWLEDNGIEMYSTHNDGKFAVVQILLNLKEQNL